MRETLKVYQSMTGKASPELVGSELPYVATQAWMWFQDLNRTRTVGFNACAISYSEMKAYFEFLGVRPSEFELMLLKVFDRVALAPDEKPKEETEK